MSEWQPVVGGRAMWLGAPCAVVCVDDDLYGVVRLPGAIATYVRAELLAEHPDDARHRRLLEAARDLVNCGYDLQTVTRLQSAVQAIDQAEADHAS